MQRQQVVVTGGGQIGTPPAEASITETREMIERPSGQDLAPAPAASSQQSREGHPEKRSLAKGLAEQLVGRGASQWRDAEAEESRRLGGRRADRKQTMAASIKLIGAAGSAKPLRQINIVGQLNHSAARGMLVILQLLGLLVLMLAAASQQEVAGMNLWPFGQSAQRSSALAGLSRGLWSAGSDSKSKRVARQTPAPEVVDPASQAAQQQRRQQATGGGGPATQSQQFHYFWNHDQIEPKTMNEEAQKILAEAQLHADQVALSGGLEGPLKRAHQQVAAIEVASSRQDQQAQEQQAAGSEQRPVVIPAAVQQQLTAMVLQMQRQQQLSMLMQPKAAARRLSAGLQVASPLSPLARYWMAGSSQQPTVVAPPPLPPPPAMLGQLTLAESAQNAASMAAAMNGLQFAPADPTGGAAAGSLGGQLMQPRAAIAGVPVYGPFMVGPSVATLMAQQQQQQQAMLQQPPVGQPAPSQASKAAQQTGRFGSSLLSRRRAWPLFGSMGASSSSSASQADRRAPIAPAASQPRPAIALPPAAAAARALALNLPPESLALIDIASNQLASAIVSQMKARSAQHLLHATGGQLAEPQRQQVDAMLASGSAQSLQFARGASQQSDQSFSLLGASPAALNSRQPPPYLLRQLLGSNALNSMTNSLLDNLHQSAAELSPSQSFEIFAANSSSLPPFGSRLKRRHSNAPLSASPMLANHAAATSGLSGSSFANMGVLVPAKSERIAPYAVQQQQQHLSRQQMDHELADETFFETSVSSHWPQASESKAVGQVVSPEGQPKSVSGGQSPRRIVKKDSVDSVKHLSHYNLAMSNTSSTAGNKSLREQSMRQLFMMVATESPLPARMPAPLGPYGPMQPASHFKSPVVGQTPTEIHLDSDLLGASANEPDSEQQTQLRRLRRSAPEVGARKPGSWASLPRAVTSGGWKSIESPASESLSSTKPMVSVEPLPLFESEYTNKPPVSPAQPSKWLASPLTSSTAAATTAMRWQKSGPETSSVAPMLKRQAELGGNESKSERAAGSDSESHRQDRSMKIRKLNGSVSVLHHTISSKSEAAARRSFVPMSGQRTGGSGSSSTSVPSSKSSQSPSTTAASSTSAASSQDQQADPMAASVSESARVVNYFANVENETPASTSRPPVQQVAATSGQQQQQQQQRSTSPQINVGFPAPVKSSSSQHVSGRLNETQDGGSSHSNKQQGNSVAGSGVFAASGGDFSSQPQTAYMTTTASPTSSFVLTQRHQRQQQRQQLAAAGNADISSAATGNLAYAVNSGAQMLGSSSSPTPSSSAIRLASSQAAIRLGTLLGATGSQSPAQGPFSSLQGAAILNTLLGLDPTQRSSTPSTTFLSHLDPGSALQQQPVKVRQQQVSSFRGQQQQQQQTSVATNSDRQTSADQSSNFNEELLPPPPQSASQSGAQIGLFGASLLNDMAGSGASGIQQQQQPGGQYVQQADQQQQQDPTGVASQQSQQDQAIAQNLAAGDHFGSRQNQNSNANSQPSIEAAALAEQGIELSRFSGQHQQVPMTNQQLFAAGGSMGQPAGAEQLVVSDAPSDFANLYGSATASPAPQTPASPNNLLATGPGPQFQHDHHQNQQQHQQLQQQQQQQLQQQPQLQQPDGSIQFPAPTGAPMAGQQPTWQQLQALGAAVSNYNQQRFSQQLEDSAAIRNSFQPTQLALSRQHWSSQAAHQHHQSAPERNFFSSEQLASQQQHFGEPSAVSPYPSSVQPFGPVDEEAAAGAAAAAGIPTYPNAAQLLAMQTHGHHHQDMGQSNLLMAGTENRQAGLGEPAEPTKSGKRKKSGNNNNKGGPKQVSHHYHFNSLSSPFEDPDSQFAPLNPLDLAGSIAANEQAAARQRAKKQQAELEEKKKQEEEEQQQQQQQAKKKKKVSLLRRFSLKNLFKRFRKDKKKEQSSSNDENSSSNDSSSSNSSSER